MSKKTILEEIKRNNTVFYRIGKNNIALSFGIHIATYLDVSVYEYVLSAIDRFQKEDYGAVHNKPSELRADQPIGIYPIRIQGNLTEDGIHCYKFLHPKYGPFLLMCFAYES